MPTFHERATEEFYAWEKRGRGWEVYDEPVFPEPPFRPFQSAGYKPEEDDGRVPTFLGSLIERVSRSLGAPAPEIPEIDEIEEPEPAVFVRDSIVELEISLPDGLNVNREAFEQFLLSLKLSREPIAFEFLAVRGKIGMQLALNPGDLSLVENQIEAHFPEAVARVREGVLEEAWRSTEIDEPLVVEFGLAHEFMLPLAGGKLDPFVGIIGALSGIREGELGLFQVIFEPLRERWAENMLRSVTCADGSALFVNIPELAPAAKHKASRPLFAAVIRIAVKSSSFDRTLDIASALAGALSVFGNPQGNELVPLENSLYPFDEHVEDVIRRQSRRPGMILSSEELVGFVHLPGSSVRSRVFQRQTGKTKAAPKALQTEAGVVLGVNVHAGRAVPVCLTPDNRVRHMHVVGTSGTGKSTFLFNLIRQDIEKGEGLAVLDPHGDLIDQILGIIPENRIQDVILFDPSDEEYSIGFNILSAHSDLEKNLLASDLVSVFHRLSTSWGDQMGSVLNNAILAFLESSKGGTLSDLRRFLIEPDYRAQFLETVNDPDIVYYWKKGFPLLAGNKSIGSVLTRLDTFLSPKPIRYMVSQKENRLDFTDIMNSGKIFLAKLSQGRMGKENSFLMGSFLVAKFHQAAMGRANVGQSERRDFWLHIDEFHNFMTPSMAEILSGARKYRIGLVLAHQELRQLQRDSDVASAVLSQCFSRVCFRVGDDDARSLASGFGFFEARDLQSLPNFEAICRVERADCDFNLHSPAMGKVDEERAAATREAVITASRNIYAVPRQKIEADQAKARAESEIAPTKKKSKAERPDDASIPSKPVEIATPTVSIAKEAPVTAQPAPVIKSVPPPLAEIEIVPQSTTAELPKRSAPAQDKGIGGHQHNLIRERIEAVARELGYSASREDPTGKGQKIDVVLTNSVRAIACEIAITTTIDHEVGNVAKCVKGGFRHIAILSPSADRLEKIKAGVSASLSPEEAASVGYYHPDEFIARLRELAVTDSAPIVPKSKETKFGKYRVKRTVASLSPEELKDRERMAHDTLIDVMQKSKRKK